jgi:hypothetical protein
MPAVWEPDFSEFSVLIGCDECALRRWRAKRARVCPKDHCGELSFTAGAAPLRRRREQMCLDFRPTEQELAASVDLRP